jgi:hypothetical protein
MNGLALRQHRHDPFDLLPVKAFLDPKERPDRRLHEPIENPPRTAEVGILQPSCRQEPDSLSAKLGRGPRSRSRKICWRSGNPDWPRSCATRVIVAGGTLA